MRDPKPVISPEKKVGFSVIHEAYRMLEKQKP
jgi:hypothetical protein